MSGGLLSGLDKAAKSPYDGWKTNSFVQCGSPENDEVCLLDDDSTDVNQRDSHISKKCLSDGNRNPRDFKANDSSFRIPRKTDSPDSKAKIGGVPKWFHSSFNKTDRSPMRNCRKSPHNEKPRPYPSRITQKDEIGYRVLRQSQGSYTPPTRWRHTTPPGTYSSLRNAQSRSQQEKILSCQVPIVDVSEKCNGSVSTADSVKESANDSHKSLAEEQEDNRLVIETILEGKSVDIKGVNVDMKEGENSKTDVKDLDANFRTKSSISQQHDTPTSSRDILSDDNYEDAFAVDHCEKCLGRFTRDKKCPNCDKDIFPSQAVTPRKSLSPDRFYSSNSQRPKVQRTYSKTRAKGVSVLLTGSAAKSTDAKNSSGSCQTNSRMKKRKNLKKSNSEDSDSDNTQGKKKRNGKQLKLNLPKKVDVITLSDEEEIVETKTELMVNESESEAKTSGSESVTVIPVSPTITADSLEEDAVNSDSLGSETKGKRKTPPSKEKPQAKKKSNNLRGYTRDDLEIEIMIGQDVRVGTLACTAADPLKITGHNDEIKLKVDYGNRNVLLTISGKDLASFKISHGLKPDVIVLGVTPGYALKLTQRIPNEGKFLNPGSAVASERDIVLEVSEHVKKEVIADLMEWVTDKLSKEFAELSIKEVERIMSYKACTSTNKEPTQTPDEVTTTPMSTRSRTYNTRTNSSRQRVQAARRLIVYPPPPQPGGITVTTEDIPCLQAGEFLNDVIIDFYLKFVFYEKLKAEDRARTHILSSFFYKRLTQRNNNTSESFTSTPDRMHSQVRTWTKNVDIFEKDFVFVPINESSHWYLAVICFPGHTSTTYINEIPDEDDDTNTKENKDSDVDESVTEEKGSANDNSDDEGDDDDDDFELTSLAKLQSTSSKPKTRRKSVSKQIIKSQPCILVFDSLGGSRSRCMFNLRNYLRCEWRERKKDGEPRDFNKDNIKGSHPKVPQQDNFCDCGVYVLQYMESFFEDPITDFSLPIKKPEWFSLERITQKRNDIRELIYNLQIADS